MRLLPSYNPSSHGVTYTQRMHGHRTVWVALVLSLLTQSGTAQTFDLTSNLLSQTGDENSPATSPTDGNGGVEQPSQDTTDTGGSESTQNNGGEQGTNTSPTGAGNGAGGAGPSTQVTQQTSVVVTTRQTTVQDTNVIQTPVTSATNNAGSSTAATLSHAASASSIKVAISTDSLGVSAVVVVNDLTTTIPAGLASSVAAAASSSQAALQGDGAGASGGSSAKTWAIPVGVVGGLVVFAGLAYVLWRLCRRRSFGDEDAPIRWPEVKPSDDNSTLMPVGARRVHGAGIEFPSDSSHHAHSPSAISGSGSFMTMRANSPSVLNSSGYGSNVDLNRQPSSALYAEGGYGQDGRRSYYDPYLGSSDTYPPPVPTESALSDVSRRPSSHLSAAIGPAGLPRGAASASGATSGSRSSLYSVEDSAIPAHGNTWAAVHAHYLADGEHDQEALDLSQRDPFATPPFATPALSSADVQRSGTIKSDTSPTSSMKLSVANPSNDG